MTEVAIAIPHLKMHGFAGDHLLERCEDAGCTVDEQGNADCGRLACPTCGFSGSNVTVPERFDGRSPARCSCGHAWIPEPERARVAA
jgi:hypothetical protein